LKLSRRGFFAGLAASLAAPAIVRAGILMPVRAIAQPRVLTIQEITRASVRLFVNTNAFLADLDRQQFALCEASAPRVLTIEKFSGTLRKGDIITFSSRLPA
jgi:hypothetical protein